MEDSLIGEGPVIYNVTTRLSQQIAAQWLHWLRQEHIPDMVATQCFTHATVLRLIEVDETEGPTYAVQYHAESKALYNQYIERFADSMRKKAVDKWGEQAFSFRSVLAVVN